MDTITDRLEQVREARGIPSVRAFWQALNEKGDLGVAYETARNYHAGREPPTSYLVAVSRVFGADLVWLATGEGVAFPSNVVPTDVLVGDRLLEETARSIPQLSWLSPHARDAFFQTWANIEGLGWVYQAVYAQLTLKVGKALWATLMKPFKQLGVEPAYGSEEFSKYAAAILAAIDLATLVPRQPK